MWSSHQDFFIQRFLTLCLRYPNLDTYGSITDIKDHRLPKKLLYCELPQGKRSQGGQKRRFKDTLKVSMKSFGVASNCLEYLALDRDKWREAVKRGAKVCETLRNAATELSCAGNVEKALPHQPLLPPFLVLSAQDSSAYRLVSLAICTLTDAFLNHKVDRMVLIDYDGQKKKKHALFIDIPNYNTYIYMCCVCVCVCVL